MIATRKNNRGYTLIEMVMAASLAALLTTIGVYSFRTAVTREEVASWARGVSNEIAAAQQAAITRRTVVTATFQNQTLIVVGSGTTLRQETLPSHITFGSTLQTVIFDRRGLPSGTPTLTLTSTAAGRTYTITIDAVTGQVSYIES
jgi:prepilin-type N-terminal cleavage/methylation domain-containing protein